MSLESDLVELKDKVEEMVAGVQSGAPTLEQKVFSAVEQVLLDAGYTKPQTEAPAEGADAAKAE